MGPQQNPLGAISGILPLLLIMPMIQGLTGGSAKKNYLTHSPGRNTGKIVMGAVAILGGLAASVAAPIIYAVVRSSKDLLDPSLTTVALLQPVLSDNERASFAGNLTAGIGAGVGLVAAGVGEILAKA